MRSLARGSQRIALIGLLGSALLFLVIAMLRQHTLATTSTASYIPLTGDAHWEGEWHISELGADPGVTGTSRVTIPFTGTEFAVTVRRSDYRAYLFVSIDGSPSKLLPRETRGAYLVLTSPDGQPEVTTVQVARDLASGPHSATIVAEYGWGQWPLVGWQVGERASTLMYDRALRIVAIVALICLPMAGSGIWRVCRRPIRRGATFFRRSVDRMRACAVPAWTSFTGSSLGRTWLALRAYAADHDTLALTLALATAGAFYFSPCPPLTVVAGLGLFLIILLRLDVGVGLVVATAPFYRHPRPLLGKAFAMSEITLLLSAVSWAVGQWHAWLQTGGWESPQSANRWKPDGLDCGMVAFAIVGLLSVANASHVHVALREFRLIILEPVILYLIWRTACFDRRGLWHIVDLMALSAAAVAAIGLVQYALGVNIITAEEGFRRLRSVYGSPNNAALMLGRVLPLLLAIGAWGTSRKRRIAYVFVGLLVALAILLSFSKGAILLGVPITLLALGFLRGRPWSWAAVGALVLAGLASIPLLRTPRFATLFDTQSGSTFFRLQVWRSAWTMFLTAPWLGVGPDNFLYLYRSRFILPAAWQEPNISQAHNVFLNYATRLGVAGLCTGIWLQIAFWKQALPLRHLCDRDRCALALGTMGMMANFLAHGMVDSTYFVIDMALIFVTTLGLVQWVRRSKDYGIES